MEYPSNFQNVIDNFKRLSGVGAKSAEKMAYDVLNMSVEEKEQFSKAISNLNEVKHCKQCFNISEEEICEICSNPNRDQSLVCVVHYPKDVFAFEKIKEFNGVYHVLNGYVMPSKNKSLEDLTIDSLVNRVKEKSIKEIILATNLNVEGEMTALYLIKLLKEYGVKITRLAHGLPMGAMLDYADEMTLFKAFSNRKEV